MQRSDGSRCTKRPSRPYNVPFANHRPTFRTATSSIRIMRAAAHKRSNSDRHSITPTLAAPANRNSESTHACCCVALKLSNVLQSGACRNQLFAAVGRGPAGPPVHRLQYQRKLAAACLFLRACEDGGEGSMIFLSAAHTRRISTSHTASPSLRSKKIRTSSQTWRPRWVR